jgi:DNA-binding NarL/FixJ family response regulator
MNTLKNSLILAIDNDPQVLLLFNELLVDKCKELLLQNDIEQGLKLAGEKQPNLILLDITVSKMDGYEICERLKANQQTAPIPVIFFSSLMRTADKVKSFEVGGVGYISKPTENRRSSDIKAENRKTQMDNMLAQIESCLITHSKAQQIVPNQSLKILENLQQYQFKSREIDILRLYISGYKRSEIATRIYLSENTVKWYLKQIFQKLAVNNRADLIAKMRELEF